MKRRDFERYLQSHGCEVLRQGKHEIWWNPATGAAAVPRHTELVWFTVRQICRDLGIPEP